MKMNLSNIMFMTLLMTSTIMTTSSNNILFSWMSMEINLISFLPLMSKSKKISDQTMKYFIIQSSSSSMMLMAILMNTTIESPLNESMLLMMSMLMKLGMMPTHLWMPNLMQNLSWINCMIMSTWQKIIPTTITFQTIDFKMMTLPMIMTMLLSPIVGMKQLSTKKMMAYSSISNSPWMVSSIFISKNMFFTFTSIYSILSIMTMNMFKNQNFNYMNQMKMMKKNQKLNMMIMMLSISGMPPMIGFMPKWLILQMMINKSMIMSSSMIISSTISSFMYMKMISNTMMSMSTKKKKKMINSSMKILILNTTSMPMMIMILKTL